MDALPQLCTAIVILLFLSAFFSASEMALTAASSTRMKLLAEEYPFLERFVDWVNEDRYQAISAILVGNNLVNVAASVTATALATSLIHEHGVAFAVVVMSILIIIFGEVIPKCVAMAKGERLLIVALPLVRFFSWLVTPLIWGMEQFARIAGYMTGWDLSLKDSFVTKEEIGQVVKIGEASRAIEESERQMIDGVISFDEIRVSEIMIPRTRMHMIESERTVDDALQFIEKMGDSRVPVFTDTPDRIEGIVLVKDLLTALMKGQKNAPVTKFMRTPLFVPETMYVPKLFRIMQNVRMHMAVVVDEYGGTAGLITLEDLLEEIVGEIQDEYDKEEQTVTPLSDGTYRAKASIPLEELNDVLNSHFVCDDVDTLGGFLLDRFGNFPHEGDTLASDGWLFEIASMDGHRINDVMIRRNSSEAGE